MSDEELDNIAGGTVGELEELTVALMKTLPSSSIHGFNIDGPAAAHIPGVNGGLAKAVSLILEKGMGIWNCKLRS